MHKPQIFFNFGSKNSSGVYLNTPSWVYKASGAPVVKAAINFFPPISPFDPCPNPWTNTTSTHLSNKEGKPYQNMGYTKIIVSAALTLSCSALASIWKFL